MISKTVLTYLFEFRILMCLMFTGVRCNLMARFMLHREAEGKAVSVFLLRDLAVDVVGSVMGTADYV